MLYEYRCPKCKRLETAYRSVAERHKGPECSACNVGMIKIISSYRVIGDLKPYYDDNLETFIESRAHRKKVMAEQGVHEHFGQNWHTSAKKHRKVG